MLCETAAKRRHLAGAAAAGAGGRRSRQPLLSSWHGMARYSALIRSACRPRRTARGRCTRKHGSHCFGRVSEIGGAICFDVYYPRPCLIPKRKLASISSVIPSLTPAGTCWTHSALIYGVPFVLAYSPWSRILDRDGTELAAGGYRSETLRFGFGSPVLQATINFDAVTLFADHNQEKMRDVQRHYGNKVRVRFDQPNCVFTAGIAFGRSLRR